MSPRIVVLVLDPIPFNQLEALTKRVAVMLNRVPDEIVLSVELAQAHNARFAFGIPGDASQPQEDEVT